MTTAVKTATFVSGLAPHEQITGQGMKCASYTVTTANASDWVVLSDFTTVVNVYAELVSTGVNCACTIDGTTTNKVVLTGTAGANRLIAWGY